MNNSVAKFLLTLLCLALLSASGWAVHAQTSAGRPNASRRASSASSAS